jgi:hypothetical protein
MRTSNVIGASRLSVDLESLQLTISHAILTHPRRKTAAASFLLLSQLWIMMEVSCGDLWAFLGFCDLTLTNPCFQVPANRLTNAQDVPSLRQTRLGSLTLTLNRCEGVTASPLMLIRLTNSSKVTLCEIGGVGH